MRAAATRTRQGSHSFTDKKPGLFQDFPGHPWKIFQDPFGARKCLNIKKKTAFTYNIQSVVHCRKFSMKQNVDVSCSEFRWTTRKMHDFQGYFSRTLSFNFQDFPGPNRFSKTFQVLEFSRKKSRTLQEAWEPWSLHATVSRTLSFNFQDFPGPKWFSRTFQVLEFSRKNPGLSRRRGNPDHCTQLQRSSRHKTTHTLYSRILMMSTRKSDNNIQSRVNS